MAYHALDNTLLKEVASGNFQVRPGGGGGLTGADGRAAAQLGSLVRIGSLTGGRSISRKCRL